MTVNLNIAGVRYRLYSDRPIRADKELRCFSNENMTDTDVNVTWEESTTISDSDGKLMVDEAMKWFHKPGEEKEFSVYVYDSDQKTVIYRLEVNRLWNEAVITYLRGDKEFGSSFTGAVGEILFRNRILYQEGIVIHAAAIDWNGKGVVFSAPSGTGKTTQANLWVKYRKAEIINADRPAIRLAGGIPYVYGTPWNGSSPKSKNRYTPLAAVIILEQSKENRIRRLDYGEAAAYLMPRCFLPYYDKDIMNLSIDIIERLIRKTPVYLLQCRPDKEAVELVYQWIR